MYKKINKEFTEGVCWWDQTPSKDESVDLIYYINDYKKRGMYSLKFFTTVFNYREFNNFNEIIAKFKSSRRSDFKRSLGMDIDYSITTSPNKIQFEIFIKRLKMFNDIMDLAEIDVNNILEMISENKILISMASVDNDTLCYNVYYATKGIARLLYSFKNIERERDSISSISNTFLIGNDIKYFQSQGYDVYDFGGLYQEGQDQSSVQGIIKFKRSFGGDEIQIWKNIEPITELGEKIYNSKFKNRL